ncbi:MAG: NHL repeat-containing protein [Planctomycetota bacterium]|nr:NHL repeat-containing protein [Planctomycetota bacterium]
MLGPLALLACALPLPAQDSPTHLGTWVHTIHNLATPSSVAVGPQQQIHVVETSAHRVRVFDKDGKQLEVLSSVADPMCLPLGVAVAPDGKRFVSDSGNHRVLVFDTQGNRVAAFGSLGTGPGQFHTPVGIDVNRDQIVVADRGNRRVQVFDHKGTHLRTLALPDAERGSWPSDVMLSPDGNTVVLDAGSSRLLSVGSDGQTWSHLGAFGFFPGTFATPQGLGRDGDNLLVTDFENHRVQVFPFSAITPAATARSSVARPAYILGIHAIRPREGRGKLHYPRDVAVSPDGSFAVLVEPWDGRAQVFARAAGAQPEPDTQRQVIGQAAAHYGMHLASDGPILAIVEPETAEVLLHDIRQPMPEQRMPPILVSRTGGRGRRLGLFQQPTGLCIDYERRSLLVCDTGNRRLHSLTFRHDPEKEIEQDFEMVSAVRMLDFQQPTATGSTELPWKVKPIAVTTRKDGALLVLDGANSMVHEFDPDWNYLRSLGGHGTSANQLKEPVDMALAPGDQDLYITDRAGARVVRWPLGEGEPQILGVGILEVPHGVAVGSDGRVYVSDSGAHRIVVFDQAGDEINRFGTRGLIRGSFDSPRGLVFNQAGELIVLDHANHRGIIVTPDGEYVDAFGSRSYIRPAQKPESFSPEDYSE